MSEKFQVNDMKEAGDSKQAVQDPAGPIGAKREMKGETIKHIVPPKYADTASLKIFITGSPRSGTSAMYLAMRSVLGVPGRGESHLIPGIQRMTAALNLYVDDKASKSPGPILLKEFNRLHFENYIFDYFREFYRHEYQGDRWVDKTPSVEAILGIPLVLRMFPDAKMILTRRHGVEMVQSHRMKFNSEFNHACLAWTRAAEAIITIRNLKVDVLEIDQFDMSNDPDGVAVSLGVFLNVPKQVRAFSKFFSESRVDKLSTHDWKKSLTLNDVDWAPKEKAIFKRLCGRAMENLGYQY